MEWRVIGADKLGNEWWWGGGVEVTETAVILNLEWVKFCLGMRVEKGCVYKNAYISATVGRKILKKICMGRKLSWLTFLLQAFFDSISN